MREAVLKLTMDYKMTKHMLNNGTLNESRTWLLVRTWHCYFISFNNEHPVGMDMITSEREARSEFLLIYTKNLSMSGRPAGRPWSRF